MAHVLFGGVFMLGAMVMFMLFLGRSSRWLASLFAGIGFGLFIDEVGKFLTQDNNYFFKPAAAVMYLFIVLVYVISAFLVRRRALSDRELVVNSLKMMQEMAADNLDAYEAAEMRRMLAAASSTEPLRDPLVDLLENVNREPIAVGRINRVYVWVRRRAIGLARLSLLQRMGVVLFQIVILLSVVKPTQELVDSPSTFAGVWAGAAWLVFVMGVVATVFYYRGQHVRSLQIFALALTLELLVVQFFELLDEPWLGVGRVLVNVVLLGSATRCSTASSTCRPARSTRRRSPLGTSAPTVPGAGLEPAQPCGQSILSAPCLPFHHPGRGAPPGKRARAYRG